MPSISARCQSAGLRSVRIVERRPGRYVELAGIEPASLARKQASLPVSPVYILPTFILTKGFVLIIGYSLYALLFPCASSGFVHLAVPVFALMKTRPHVMPCDACHNSSVYVKALSHVTPVL